MIFLRYESFRGYLKSFPVTSAIVALCTLYFLFMFIMGDVNSVYEYGAFLTHPVYNPFSMDEPWRYITSIFMHANFMHLIQNMIMLIIMAPPLERIMKSGRYLIFYLLCGIGGNFISACVNNLTSDNGHLAVGASGAIYGVLGAYLFLVVFRKKWLDPASIRTIYWIVGTGIVFSLVYPSVDFWGHVGGLITGFILYRLFDRIHLKKRIG